MLGMDDIGALDPQLLGDVLIAAGVADGPIATMDVRPVGQGLLGSSHRIGLTYAPGARGIAAIVLKMHSEHPAGRKLGRYGNRIPGAYGFYASEVAFYRDFAPDLTLRVPDCYAAAIDADFARFILLLEAIEPASTGDDLESCSAERLALAVTNIAGLHGPSWGIVPPASELGIYNARGPHSAVLQSHMLRACEINTQKWADQFSREEFDAFFRFADSYDVWQRAEGRPRGIVHLDHRLDNLLFFDDRDEVVVVDWQTVQFGMPIRDIGQLFAASIDGDLRRRHEHDMLRRYHEALGRQGVSDYPFDTLVDDYHWSLLQGLHGAVFGLAQVPLEGRRGRELFLEKARRTLTTLREYRDRMPIDVFAN